MIGIEMNCKILLLLSSIFLLCSPSVYSSIIQINKIALNATKLNSGIKKELLEINYSNIAKVKTMLSPSKISLGIKAELAEINNFSSNLNITDIAKDDSNINSNISINNSEAKASNVVNKSNNVSNMTLKKSDFNSDINFGA